MALTANHAKWVFPLVALAFCTWLVSLGGLSALQHDCGTQYAPAVRGFSVATCRRVYRYYWFIVAFEFAVLAGVAMSTVAAKLVHSRIAWVGMLAIATLLYMQASDSFLTGQRLPAFAGGQPMHRARTMTAGCIMTTVANIFLLLALGWVAEETAVKRTTVGETNV